jgi:ribosome-binding factor A
MTIKRTDRLNSLLKEVISEVINRNVKNPSITGILTVTRVDITKDLRQAKVFISVIGTDEQKAETINALQSAAGFIAVTASKKVVMRFFPTLTFKLDEGVSKHVRIQEILQEIKDEESSREESSTPPSVDDE